jgi:hypothetical protein
MSDRPTYDELAEFVTNAVHDLGCAGDIPEYRCRCGLRVLRLRLGVTPEPDWDGTYTQPTMEST